MNYLTINEQVKAILREPVLDIPCFERNDSTLHAHIKSG